MDRIAKMASQPLARVGWWLGMGNALVAVLLCTATFLNLDATWDTDHARAAEVADNLAHSVSIELAAELRLVDNALVSVGQRLPVNAGADPHSAAALLNTAIREQAPLVPFVAAIRFASVDGAVGADSTGGPPIRIGDRAYFQRVLQSDGPVLSDPLVSRVLSEWCVILARRVVGPDGQVRGVVYAVLVARHFSTLFSKLALGDGGVIALRTQDFKLVARHAVGSPPSTDGMGQSHVSPELRAASRQYPAFGRYTSKEGQDKVERLYAYRAVPGFPLVLVAGLSSEQYVVAPWKAAAWRHWGFTALVMLLVLGGSVYVHVQHVRAREAAQYTARLARQQALMIENEWVGMLRVRQRRIEWLNQAAARILGHNRTVLLEASTRVLYPDQQAFEAIGEEGYRALRERGGFHTQVLMRTGNDARIWVDLSGTALSEDESVWMLVDIDGLKHSEAHAHHLALHDALTGLANRRSFDDQLRHALERAGQTGQGLAVCYMDLDGFKAINDRFGHDAGDAVLYQVGERLAAQVRASDLVARLGGDEFALVLAGAAEPAEVEPILQRCLEALHAAFPLPDGTPVQIGSSVGVAFGTTRADTPHGLLAAADAAMYAAKRAGKGRIVFAPGRATADAA
ncbi:diguanylate cyclase [Ideonella sp. B7]|uniref:bifunctional diguanylate cyclase/phosphodiesterase n=1 Tax=Ideonella benzenivorans TaxID=2831643 RepID=UPI001CEC4CD0|nr:diguanylate cyclase [Ideonella benzenivorans]MCA6215645.1 diguanylate cyclase [Ideonella benzenivorans]